MVAENSGLAMKFKDVSDDTVYFDASAHDKQNLIKMIDASERELEGYRVEILTYTGAQKEDLDRMRDIISETIDDDSTVAMSQGLFQLMGSIASTWKFHGFDGYAEPEDDECLGVPRDTVDSVMKMREDYLGM